MAESKPIVKEIFLESTPEDIFPYLTLSNYYTRWMGIAAELDARPGGTFRFDPNGSGRDVISGKFVEVTPPRRVVFTWGYERAGHAVPPGSTTVEIELVSRQGGTLLRLVHSGLDADQRAKHTQGWSHYLERLQIRIAGRDPGQDPFADLQHVHG